MLMLVLMLGNAWGVFGMFEFIFGRVWGVFGMSEVFLAMSKVFFAILGLFLACLKCIWHFVLVLAMFEVFLAKCCLIYSTNRRPSDPYN